MYKTLVDMDEKGVRDDEIKYSSEFFESDDEKTLETRGFSSLE